MSKNKLPGGLPLSKLKEELLEFLSSAENYSAAPVGHGDICPSPPLEIGNIQRLEYIGKDGGRLVVTSSKPARYSDSGYMLASQYTGDAVSDVDWGFRSKYLSQTLSGGMMGGYIEPGFPLYFISDGLLDYLGYESREEFEEAIDGLVDNCMHPNDREMVNKEVTRQLALGEEYHIIYRMLKKDGSAIWVDDTGKEMIAADGRRAITSVCLDVTGLQEAKSKLEETNLKLDSIINAIPGGVAIWRVGEKLDMIYFSDGVPAQDGYTTAEYTELLKKDELVLTHPDDREMLRQKVRYAAEKHLSADFEYRTIHKNGSIVWVHLIGSYAGSENGMPLIQCVFNNITNQKNTELELRMEQMKTNLALQNLPVKIWEYRFFDNELLLETTNEDGTKGIQRISDIPNALLLGRAIHPDSVNAIRGIYESIISGKDVSNVGVQSDFFGLGMQWWRVSGRVIRENGEPVYAIGTVEDITEETEAIAVKKQMLMAISATNLSIFTYDIQKDIFHIQGKKEINPLRYESFDGSMREILKSEMVMPDSIENFINMHEQLKSGKKNVSAIIHFNPEYSEAEWRKITYSTIFDDNGKASVAAGISEDITEHVRARERYKSEMQALVESQGNSLLSKFRTNLTRNTVDHYTGYRERAGRQGGETFTSIINSTTEICVNPADAERIRDEYLPEKLLKKYRRGETAWSLEYQIRTGDGEIVWVRTALRAYRDPASGDIVAFCYTYDINESKMVQLALHAVVDKNYKVVAIANADTDVIFCLVRSAFDKLEHKRFKTYNDFICGISDGWQMQFENDEGYRQIRAIANIESLKKLLESSGSYSVNLQIWEKGGSRRYVFQLNFSYVGDDKKQIMISVADITGAVESEMQRQEEIRQALERARQATAAKSNFLAQMSHDIRTPLNAILGMADIGLYESEPSKVRESLETIKISGKFLLSLINDILDISKSESSDMVLNEEICNVNDFETAINSSIKPLMESKNIKFEMRMECGLINIYADAMRMVQLFQNLLGNAAKYTPSGGSVVFSAHCLKREGEREWTRFIVRDTGVGMSEDFARRAFEPFTRETGDTDDQWQGTGLGLTIVKRIVEAMGGVINLETEKGKGTTFTVDLPLLPTESPQEEESAAPQDNDEYDDLKGLVVLLAEDNRINRMVASQILSRKGIRVIETEDGKQCLERYVESGESFFDAVLLDIRMPVMDGLRAAKSIRALKRADAKTVPIFAMTANAYAEDEKLSLQAGMDEHITKPIDPNRVYALLRKYRR